MVRRAIDIGVPEERIARALNLAANTIRRNQTLLQGICAEAIELLKDKHVATKVFMELKKVKPMRQIEIAELMTAAGTYVSTYASALVGLTPEDQLADVSKTGKKGKARSQVFVSRPLEDPTAEKELSERRLAAEAACVHQTNGRAHQAGHAGRQFRLIDRAPRSHEERIGAPFLENRRPHSPGVIRLRADHDLAIDDEREPAKRAEIDRARLTLVGSKQLLTRDMEPVRPATQRAASAPCPRTARTTTAA